MKKHENGTPNVTYTMVWAPMAHQTLRTQWLGCQHVIKPLYVQHLESHGCPNQCARHVWWAMGAQTILYVTFGAHFNVFLVFKVFEVFFVFQVFPLLPALPVSPGSSARIPLSMISRIRIPSLLIPTIRIFLIHDLQWHSFTDDPHNKAHNKKSHIDDPHNKDSPIDGPHHEDSMVAE